MNAYQKARRYLSEGRCRILELDESAGVAQAEFRGDSGRIHVAGWDSEGVFCCARHGASSARICGRSG